MGLFDDILGSQPKPSGGLFDDMLGAPPQPTASVGPLEDVSGSPANAPQASPARPDTGSVEEWLQNLPQGMGQMSPEEMSRTGQTQYEPSTVTAGTEPTKISEALRANVQPMLEHPVSSFTGMFTNWDDVKRLYEQPQDILGPTAKRFAGMQVRPDEEIGSQNFYNTAVMAALVGAGKLGAKGEPRAAEAAAEKPPIQAEAPPVQEAVAPEPPVQGTPEMARVQPAEQSAIVPRPQLFLQFGDESHPVESIADASRRFSMASDAAVSRQGTEGVPVNNRIVDQNGNAVGRISPNGKVWDADDNLIYDPRLQPEPTAATIPTPDEQTGQVAEAARAQTVGGEEPARSTFAPNAEPAGVEQPGTGATGAGERPGIGVAEQYANEELGAGSVIPGETSGTDWNTQADAYINSGQDPRMPIRAAVAGHVSPRNVAIVSSNYRRLAQNRRLAADALEQNPRDPAAQQNYQVADQSARAWRQEMQPVLTRWAETGHAIQGEPAVDLTTFDGLYQKATELNGGREPTFAQKAQMTKLGQVGRKLRTDEGQAVAARDAVISKTLPKAKLRSPEEMQAMVDNMVKRMTPCG